MLAQPTFLSPMGVIKVLALEVMVMSTALQAQDDRGVLVYVHRDDVGTVGGPGEGEARGTRAKIDIPHAPGAGAGRGQPWGMSRRGAGRSGGGQAGQRQPETPYI